MKTLFVVISKDVIRRNILETGFWDTLIERPKDWRIVLIVEKGREEEYRKYAGEQVMVEGYEKVFKRSLYARLINYLIRTGVNSHSARTYRNRAYRRGESSLVSFLTKGYIANTLGRFSWFKSFIRNSFLGTQMPKGVHVLFEKYQPDIVFTPSLIDHEFDVVFGVVAKQKNIHLVGMVRSWDNLNNHGILSVVPNYFIFQNTFLIDAAEKFQGIDTKRLRKDIVGLPHYDEYFDPSKYVKSREEFFSSFGLDPNKHMLLLGGSDFYYSEDILPKTINDAIEGGSIQKDAQVVFRPHPGSPFKREEYGLDLLSHIVLDDAFSGKTKFSDTEKFINLMYHADIVVNICSTLSIDAAVFKTPAICINYDDPKRKLSYYEQVGRLYDHFDHYEELVAMGGVILPESPEELADAINIYLDDPGTHGEGREAIIERFVAPFDGQAGKRLGNFVLNELENFQVLG